MIYYCNLYFYYYIIVIIIIIIIINRIFDVNSPVHVAYK